MTPIVSKKVLVNFVNLQEDDTRFDKVLEWLAGVSSNMIQDYLGRDLEESARVQYCQSYAADELTAPGDCQLCMLNSFPIASNVTLDVRYSDTLSWDSAVPYVEGVDYIVNREKGELRIFPAARKGITSKVLKPHPMGFRISTTAGYAKVTAKWSYLNVPTEMATAAAVQTAFFFHSHMRGSIGFDSAAGDTKDSKKSEISDKEKLMLLPEVRSMLDPFRRKANPVGVFK